MDPLGHRFYGSIAKSLQNSAKIVQKFTVWRKGGGRTIAPPEYATIDIIYLPSCKVYDMYRDETQRDVVELMASRSQRA